MANPQDSGNIDRLSQSTLRRVGARGVINESLRRNVLRVVRRMLQRGDAALSSKLNPGKMALICVQRTMTVRQLVECLAGDITIQLEMSDAEDQQCNMCGIDVVRRCVTPMK